MLFTKLIYPNKFIVLMTNSAKQSTSYKSSTIGTTTSFIYDKTAVISSINIIPPYKRLNHGSTLLKATEDYLKSNFNIKKTKLLAWQPTGSTDLVDFYVKNNYAYSNTDIRTYDDGVQIFDLYRFHKHI